MVTEDWRGFLLRKTVLKGVSSVKRCVLNVKNKKNYDGMISENFPLPKRLHGKPPPSLSATLTFGKGTE